MIMVMKKKKKVLMRRLGLCDKKEGEPQNQWFFWITHGHERFCGCTLFFSYFDLLFTTFCLDC